MALGLGNIFVDGGFGTRFAPGVNGISVHCLIVRCAFVSKNQSALSESELTSAIEMLRSIIPDEELELLAPTGPATVYTTTLTLWMLILQRLGKGTSLNTVVKDVLSNSRQLLPDNRRVRENTLSEKSGAYSDARNRLARHADAGEDMPQDARLVQAGRYRRTRDDSGEVIRLNMEPGRWQTLIHVNCFRRH